MAEQAIDTPQFNDIKFFKRGKVREIYDLDDAFLMVATDRISCFDVILPTGIPRKGEVLTRISLFWFDFTKDVVRNHLISADVDQFPQQLQKYKNELAGRSMLVKKANPFPVECVVRGYLSGSGWKEYQETQSICGIALPAGLKESEKLPEPIFTPSTKADVGHDMNVSFDYVSKQIGSDVAEKLKEVSILLYTKAAAYAQSKGIIVADTKFEFGTIDDDIILIDEVLTPDSSRLWPQDHYTPGQGQPSFDKQFVRDYLETLDWDKTPPGPELPDEIVQKTTEKYLQAIELITGKKP